MNKKILCVLPLGLLCVACGPQKLATFDGCRELPTPRPPCVPQTDERMTPFVNVTPNGWVVAPPNLCVTPGGTVEIRFLPPNHPPPLNTLGTVPKGKPAFWLIGRNSSDPSKIVLTVPEGLEKGDYFDYGILSESDGCVDPRFTYN